MTQYRVVIRAGEKPPWATIVLAENERMAKSVAIGRFIMQTRTLLRGLHVGYDIQQIT